MVMNLMADINMSLARWRKASTQFWCARTMQHHIRAFHVDLTSSRDHTSTATCCSWHCRSREDRR